MAAPALTAAQGPWGSVDQLMSDQAASCIHMVWPTTLSNRITNIQLHPSFDDGSRLTNARNGSGDWQGAKALSRASGLLVEASHSKQHNNGRLAVLLLSNVFATSFNNSASFGAASANLGESNGRLFVIEGDIAVEISNFNVMGLDGYGTAAEFLWVAGEGSERFSLRARGVVLGDEPSDDVSVQMLPPTARKHNDDDVVNSAAIAATARQTGWALSEEQPLLDFS